MALTGEISAELRESGTAFELDFWREFCTSDRFVNNFCAATPNPELDLEAEIFVKGLACEVNKSGRELSVLDIGSGPVSMLSKSFLGQRVELTAADPLADLYAGLWSNSHKNELVCPVACDGEELSKKFGTSRFDVVHIRNALDHTIHPIAVVSEMIKVAKPGGYLFIHGFENEADREGWTGFHQWNISYAPNDLVIRGKDGESYSLVGHFAPKLVTIRSWRRMLVTNVPWCGIAAQVLG